MRFVLLSLLSIAAVLAVGCTAPSQPTLPTVMRLTAQTHDDYEQLFDTVSSSLRSYNFRLDRQDHLDGVITTFPETSTAWFEIWRPQPHPAYYWAESNFKTVQRQVTVKIQPVADAKGTYDLDVEVLRSEYSLTERQVDNSAAALRLFSPEAPTEQGRMEKPSQTGRWIPLGRDEFMENDILNHVTKHYVAGQVVQTQPAFGPRS